MTLTTIGTRGRAGAVRRATDEEIPDLTGALAACWLTTLS